MHVDYRPQWVITISSDELSLIGKALSGRLNEEDKQAALALNVAMCHSRTNRAEEVAECAGKALASAWKRMSPEQEAALKLQYEQKEKKA
jgi:hypothetical protein